MAKFGLPGGRRTRQPQQKARTAGDVRLALNFALDTDQARGSAVVFSGSPERVTNPLGVARKFDAQAKYATITRVGGPLIQTGNFSIIYQFKMLGAPINGGLMLQIPGTSGSNNLLNMYTLNTGVIRCDMHSLAGAATTVDSAAVIADGGTYTAELVNNNGTLQWYINGVASGAAAAMPARDGESTTIRVTNGGADATPNHEITLVAFRSNSRVLGTNPWQLFQPRKRQIYAAAATSATLVLADVAHGHTLDAVSLTQAHNLAQTDVAHGHTLDAVSLTQTHNLVQSDVLHAHAVDNVALDTALVVSDIAHGHTLNTVSLTQAHNLSVADISHAHTLGAVGFGGDLLIADIAHGFTLDSIDFPPLWTTISASSGLWTDKPLSGSTWTTL